MASTDKPTVNISELIDRIEQVREELLAIQGAMEKLERVGPSPRNRARKSKSHYGLGSQSLSLGS
jgi:hypothetical protein